MQTDGSYTPTHIWLVPTHIGGGEARCLTDGEQDDHSVTWSPDSTEICFVSNRTGDWDNNGNNGKNVWILHSTVWIMYSNAVFLHFNVGFCTGLSAVNITTGVTRQVFKMMNSAFKMMNSAFKMMNSAFKTSPARLRTPTAQNLILCPFYIKNDEIFHLNPQCLFKRMTK